MKDRSHVLWKLGSLRCWWSSTTQRRTVADKLTVPQSFVRSVCVCSIWQHLKVIICDISAVCMRFRWAPGHCTINLYGGEDHSPALVAIVAKKVRPHMVRDCGCVRHAYELRIMAQWFKEFNHMPFLRRGLYFYSYSFFSLYFVRFSFFFSFSSSFLLPTAL